MTLEQTVREVASILTPAVKEAEDKASRDIFGTAMVSASGAKVMLDGAASPVGCSFSVNCLDGDRVVCHIVNHRVVVFSNITNPDLSTAEVISHVKDNPNTGVIQNVVVSDSTLQDIDLHGFMATDGTIENTKISGGSIDGATLTNIPYAAIENLDAHSADIADARIGQATIKQAQVENLVADKAEINGKLTAAEGDISQLQADTADIGTIRANAAKVQNLTAAELEADHAKVGTLDATYATIANLDAATGRISDLESDHVSTTDLTAVNGEITNLKAKDVTIEGNITAATGRITTLESDNVSVKGRLSAAEGNITTLQSTKADISVLESDYAQIDLANVNNAFIKNGVFDKTAVMDETVFDLTGDKATIREINADNITVRNLHTKNLTVDTADGYVTIGDKKTPTKEYLDSLKDELQQEIDGAVETFTADHVPLMDNYPASDWVVSGDADATAKLRAKHVGDICYVQKAGDDHDGFCYRFSYDSTTQDFSWVLIKDSSVTKALGDISDLKEFQSDTATWIEETDEGLVKIRENHTRLSGVVDGVKATAEAALPATTFETFESTTFKTVTDTVGEQSTKFDQLTTTLGTNADGTTKENDIVHRTSAIEQDVSGFKQTVRETYATKSEAKQTDSDSGKREIITEDAAELPLLSLTAYGECSQDGTPTPDAPVEIKAVRGANLFDPQSSNTIAGYFTSKTPIAASSTSLIYYIPCESGASYTASRLAVVTNERLYIGYTEELPAVGVNVYGVSGAPANRTIGSQMSVSVNTPESAKYVVVWVYWENPAEALKTFQLEKDSIATPYAPYGCIAAVSQGKNLVPEIDYSRIGRVQASGTIYTSGANDGQVHTCSQYFGVIPNAEYTFSFDNTDSENTDAHYVAIAWYEVDGTLIARSDNFSGRKTTAKTYTAPSNVTYARVSAHKNVYPTLQLELGTEATEYEPYRESVSYIDLKGEELCSLPDGTQDVLTVDASGHVEIDKAVAHTDQATTDGISATVGTDAWSTTGDLSDGADVYYPAAEPQTIDLGYIDPPTTFDGGSVRVIAEIQPVIDASWWTKAGYEAGKAFNEGNTSADLTALEQRVTTAETSITQQAGQIQSKASQTEVNALSGRVSTAESAITQQAGQIEAKVSKDGVIAAINLSTEQSGGSAARISADKVNIEGAAIFTSGRLSQDSLDGAYDENGAASDALDDAKDYVDGKGYQTAGDVSQAISTGTANLAAKADAIARTQRIWYRQTADGAKPGKNETWLSTSGTGYGNWSLTVPQMTDGSTKYPKLYTAVQSQTVAQQAAGTTCSCSDVQLDDSTTVIDGGNIITGSVTANQVNFADASGNQLKLFDPSAPTNYQVISSGGNELFVDGVSIAEFGDTTRIGKEYVEGATDNESHMELDYHSLQMVDKDGKTYFHVSDLRDANGAANVVDTFTGDGSTKAFQLSFLPNETSPVTVTVDGSVVTSGAYQINTAIYFRETAPEDGATIVVEYATSSAMTKAFTFGRRNSDGNVGAYSFAEGYNTTASGRNSHAEGYNTTASGEYSHAEGYNTTASGGYSHAEGYNTTASEWYAHAEGYHTTASDVYCHAEGHDTTASGGNSHAEGYNTTASGRNSHAEGYHTTASGGNSHAEGYNTTASGGYSHAEGYHTTASDVYSHAEGRDTTASGGYSHAGGYGTVAVSRSQAAIGKYNTADTVTETFVGDGTTWVFYFASETTQVLSVAIDGDSIDYGPGRGGYSYRWSTTWDSYRGIVFETPPEDGSVITVVYAAEKYALIIGNGTADDARSNAAAIDWQGTGYIFSPTMSAATDSTPSGIQIRDPENMPLSQGSPSSADIWGDMIAVSDMSGDMRTNRAHVRYVSQTNGFQGIQMEAARRMSDGSNVYHGVVLRIDANGNRVVDFSRPHAWLNALTHGGWVTSTASEIVTAASGTTISGAWCIRWGRVASLQINFKRTSELSVPASGNVTNVTVCTLKEGFRPHWNDTTAYSTGDAAGAVWYTVSSSTGAIDIAACEGTGSARKIAADTLFKLRATYVLADYTGPY